MSEEDGHFVKELPDNFGVNISVIFYSHILKLID